MLYIYYVIFIDFLSGLTCVSDRVFLQMNLDENANKVNESKLKEAEKNREVINAIIQSHYHW